MHTTKHFTLSVCRTVLPVLLAVFSFRANAQLVINEVSQGASGTKEYVELLVTGTPTCAGIPTVDLRGWYIDDNNGTHASGSGTGIASGCIRFTNDALWSAVPAGTLIVVYNDADINASIPAQDLSLSDGNCRLVIPGSNCTLLEKHSSQPSTSNSVYPTSGFSSCGLWTTTSMSNTDDSYHTVNPAGVIVHSVSWGNNSANTNIYFSGGVSGMVIWNANTVNTSPALQGNWTRTSVAGNETPGAPNNAANATWIASMNNNCTPVVPLSASGSSTGTCACSGTGTANASGGLAPYTYSWTSGGTAATETGLCPGSYTCTVTDAAGCTQQVIVNVAGAPGPVATLQSSTNSTCNNAADGTATVNATGTGPFTYAWTPSGGTSATATGLDVGVYTCTITDANGCSTTQTVSITEPSPLSITATHTNVSCRNGTDGSASVSPSGGTGPYTYSWSPSGGNGATATSLDAGFYFCSITDANGCTSSQSFQVTQPTAVSAVTSQTNTLCNGDSNGSASVTVTGGVGGYTYAWLPSGGTSSTEQNLASGTYTCIVTDANNCRDTTTVTITEPALLISSSSASPAGCQASDGSANANVSGGTLGYSYAWTPQGGNAATALNLPAGPYTCTITDANGCTSVTSTTVTTTGSVPAAQVSASGPLSFCQGDSLVLTASGASQFLWSTTDTTASITVTAAGSYSVIVTNACGSDTTSIAVSTIAPPTATLTASGPTTFCAGDSVTLTASGGISYLWSTAETTSSIVVSAQGTYTVAVSDVCGTDSATIAVVLLNAPAINITASGPTTFCSGDSISLTATGSTSYLWSTTDTTASIFVSTAGTFTVISGNQCGADTATITTSLSPLPVAAIAASGPLTFCAGDSVQLTASGGGSYLWSTPSTNATITVTAAGTYTVAVTNACGTDTAQQTVNVLPAPNVTLSASGPLTFCEGGNVTLSATGGTSWLWSTGSTSPSIVIDTAGTWTVVVSNACGSDSASVVTGLLPLPSITMSGNTMICPGESTVLSATGGNNYLWSNGATTSSITVAAAGSYYVVSTNACGSDTATLIVQQSAINAAFTASPVSGSVPLTVNFTDQSANANTWSWNMGSAGNSSSQNPETTFDTPGTYTVILTVTNADGCTDTTSMIIVVEDVPALVEVPNVFTPNADGTNDVFIIHAEGIAEFHLEIYDRWGALMSTTDSALTGWDGRTTSGNDASDGTYYYVLRAVAYNNTVFERSGFVTLIR